MTDEEKMKLRFMAEQKDLLTKQVSSTKKRSKFLLGDSDDEGFNFLTHKGKKIDDLDKFDKISNSSEEYEDKDMRKGIMTDEMVKSLNFGGGETEGMNEQELENRKKTREERHAEIM